MGYGRIQDRIKDGEFVSKQEQMRLCADILHIHMDIEGNVKDVLARSDMTLDQAAEMIEDMYGLSGSREHAFAMKDTDVLTVNDWVESSLYPSTIKTDLSAIGYMYYRKDDDGSIVYLQCEGYEDLMYEKMLGLRVRKKVAMIRDMPVDVLSLMGIDWKGIREDLALEDLVGKHILYHYDGFVIDVSVEWDCEDLEGIVPQRELDEAVMEMFTKKEYVTIHETGHDILEECRNNEEFVRFLKAYGEKDPQAIRLARKNRWK